MIIKEQKIQMKWNGRNKKFYTEKGYKFTRIGDTFLVNAKDLAKTSKVQVTVICDLCETNVRIQKDKVKKEDFVKNGYGYVEIWEKDIYNNLEKVMKEIYLKYIPVTTARRTS